MIRHFAFTHGKLFELTEVTPAHLITGYGRGSGTPRKKKEKKEGEEEGGEQGEKGEKKTEDEKPEATNGTDTAAANEDKKAEAEEETKENGEEKKKEENREEERNATPAPIIEKAEEVRQISQVDDCKAPIIDNSSSESEEEEGGAVKVRLNQYLLDKSLKKNYYSKSIHHLLLPPSTNHIYRSVWIRTALDSFMPGSTRD